MILFIFFLQFSATQLFAQDELKLSEAFLKSVQEKNFALMKPWLGQNVNAMKEKWQQVVNNAHRGGFDIKLVKIKNIVPGRQIPNLPMKSIIAVYEYDGKDWDDLLLMITMDKKIKLVEIPLSSYMFALNEGRRGKNIKDAENN
ncbi:MAG: hypothetical protein IPL84_09050 [Chitinophagaceae bacterium]|nr:hypothetical protein [Chitinophagaceae bacterium]